MIDASELDHQDPTTPRILNPSTSSLHRPGTAPAAHPAARRLLPSSPSLAALMASPPRTPTGAGPGHTPGRPGTPLAAPFESQGAGDSSYPSTGGPVPTLQLPSRNGRPQSAAAGAGASRLSMGSGAAGHGGDMFGENGGMLSSSRSQAGQSGRGSSVTPQLAGYLDPPVLLREQLPQPPCEFPAIATRIAGVQVRLCNNRSRRPVLEDRSNSSRS